MTRTGSMIVICALAAGGCAHGKWLYAPQSSVGTAGVEIVGDKGAFRLTKQPGATPFRSGRCGSEDQDAAVGAWKDAVNLWQAQSVRVQYPGLNEPLYGILRLCEVNKTDESDGAWSREYLVQVPQSYVDATTEGRTSVVFESYATKTDKHGTGYAWILWLSRQPFAP